MDAGKALRNDHLDAKVHRRNGRVFAARALSIVAAANDEALFHGLGPFGKVRIIPAVGVLGHGGHVGAHGGKLGTCRRNIVGRYVVAGFQTDAGRERIFRGSATGSGLMLGPRTIVTSFPSGAGWRNRLSFTGYASGSLMEARTDTSSMTSSAVAKTPLMAVAAAVSGLTR